MRSACTISAKTGLRSSFESSRRFLRERWHFIGNIQSRQLPSIVGRACLIHSLYERKHAEKIDSLAAKAGIVQDVLIEVNDGEENKQGLEPDALFEMLAFCHGLKHVRVKGLMTMALRGDLQSARATFADWLSCVIR